MIYLKEANVEDAEKEHQFLIYEMWCRQNTIELCR